MPGDLEYKTCPRNPLEPELPDYEKKKDDAAKIPAGASAAGYVQKGMDTKVTHKNEEIILKEDENKEDKA